MQYKISCAMETGVSHLNQGLPNQDRIVSRRENGVVAIVLSDGAGSRPNSQVGAEAVTQAVSQLLCSQFSALYEAEQPLLRRRIFQHGLSALNDVGLPLETLACTLLFYAADQEGRCLVGHLGDGVILQIGHSLETMWTVSHPENGEYANETWFLTSPDAEQHLRLKRGPLPPSGAMLLMSDGAASSLYMADRGIPAKACLTMGQWLWDGKEEDISKALHYNLQMQLSRRTGDDMSLGLVVWGQDLPHPHKETKEAFHGTD